MNNGDSFTVTKTEGGFLFREQANTLGSGRFYPYLDEHALINTLGSLVKNGSAKEHKRVREMISMAETRALANKRKTVKSSDV